MIDLHSHVLHGIDDGARSLEEGCVLLRAASADGITAIAATPHVSTDFPTTAEQMERGVAELREAAATAGIPVDVLHGGEIALERLLDLPENELNRFTLAQTGRYLLLEFPYFGSPAAAEPAVNLLVSAGITPLLAHPERNPEVQQRPARLEGTVALGALVQITAPSLEGRFGRASRTACEKLLELGIVHVLASDVHGPHIRESTLAAAAAMLDDPGLARYLTIEAPAAIVAGEDLPAAPAARPKRRRFLPF